MSSRLNVLICFNYFPDSLLARLDAHNCDVSLCNGDKHGDKSSFLHQVRDKDVLVVLPNTFKVDKEVLEAAGNRLKTIVTVSVGLDHLDLNFLEQRGLSVCYTPGVNTEGTAEYTIGLLLLTMLRLHEHIREAKEGLGNLLFQTLGHTMEQKVVGIFGFGALGQNVAKRLAGFNTKEIVYNSRKDKGSQVARFVSFQELVEQSDVVIITAALTESTRCIFDMGVFKRMKRSAVLVNVARGDIVQQDDLVEALQTGEIASAGLDVTSPEPLPKSHPLKTLKNAVVTPHKATAQKETKLRMLNLVVDNIIAVAKGEPLPTAVHLQSHN